MNLVPDLMARFEAQDFGDHHFRHFDHVAVAFQMLNKYSYIDAVSKYAENIRVIATNAGAPDKFNTTVTFAFIGLIAERMETSDYNNYEEFISQNKDLLSKDILHRWYAPAQLKSDLARRIFLMPNRSI